MSTVKKINIVQLQAALGLPVTADFIANTLNVAPVEQVKRAMFWDANDYTAICDRLVGYITMNRQKNPAEFSGARPKKVEDAAPEPTPAPAADDGFDFGDEPKADDGFDFGDEPKTDEPEFEF